jgi:hypothetical protein
MNVVLTTTTTISEHIKLLKTFTASEMYVSRRECPDS